LTETPGYNERLFTGGIRSQIHLARFAWLNKMVGRIFQNQSLRVIELGCYDGRSIDWLPCKPASYDGFDANWEGGLDIGKARFADSPALRFFQCSSPHEMIPAQDGYDIGISLETMEHIPPAMVDGYLDILAKSIKSTAFFSVPNEIGLPFLGKYLAKKLIYRDSMDEAYSLREVLYEILGQPQYVHRNEHKGFDYRNFIKLVSQKFIVKKVMSIPYSWLPVELSFTVGIVAEPKPR
jgi:2-polyprenyl-3-methyl-5-hydroxy-6-metoxy-1,4-benzoquinol methylase